MKKASTEEETFFMVDSTAPIIVTPTNPLAVTSSPVTYDSVSIQGGDISVAIPATVTFNTLTKVS